MTTKTTPAKRLHVDDESRSLMANPELRAVLEEAKRTPASELLTLDELDADLRLSPDDKVAAEAWLDELDQSPAAHNGAAH